MDDASLTAWTKRWIYFNKFAWANAGDQNSEPKIWLFHVVRELKQAQLQRKGKRHFKHDFPMLLI